MTNNQAHPDPTPRNQAHPNPVRAQEWYDWERQRNRERTMGCIGKGCAILILVGLAVLAWVGAITLAGAIGWA